MPNAGEQKESRKQKWENRNRRIGLALKTRAEWRMRSAEFTNPNSEAPILKISGKWGVTSG